MKPGRIIVSRIDKIGDVVLTLPLTGFLKKIFPGCTVIFLGRKYTKPVADACTHIDEFIDWDTLGEMSFSKRAETLKKKKADVIIHVFPDFNVAAAAFFAGIPERVGTGRRLYHHLFVNRKVKLSRRKSTLHESQLNIEIVRLWQNIPQTVSLEEIKELYGFNRFKELPGICKKALVPGKFNVILHPKSKGSAREWGIDRYAELVRELPQQLFNIIVSGTESEAAGMEQFLRVYGNRLTDLTGKLDLGDYISLISNADCLIACSTGPLHIAAAAGVYTVGIYAPMKPIFPQRWAPIGKKAHYLVLDKECNKCRHTANCECIRSITAKDVAAKLKEFFPLTH